MPDLVGQRLAHFRVEGVLGQGGMGVVYRAVDERLRREVALKVLPWGDAGDEVRRRRFLREARSAAAASHPCIASVHEIGEVEGYAFIAMELVRGQTLRRRLEEGLSLAEGVRIARDVARGLARAHESGVVHRDLKPENVMVTVEGDVKILDFGIARLGPRPGHDEAPPSSSMGDTKRDPARPGEVVGTVPYMSPEQARGQEADARSDVFSFGTLLYEIVCGARPFEGEEPFMVLYAIAQLEPRPANERNPEVPAALAAVIMRCLRKDRDERYASGRELVLALEGQESGPLARPSVSLAPPPEPSQPSQPRVVTVAGMGLEMASTLPPDSTTGPSLQAVKAAPSSNEPRDGRRVGWRAFGAAAAMLGALAVLVLLTSRATARHPAPAPRDDARDGGDGRAHPLSPSPEAASAFARATEDLASGDVTRALAGWERAASLDPSYCAARLRIAAYQDAANARGRQEIEKVRACEASMSAADRALARVVEAFVDPSVSAQARSAVAKEQADAFPDDVELAYFVASYFGNDTTAPKEALYWADRALDHDAAFAPAYARKAEQLRLLGRDEEADAILTACLARRADAPACADHRFNAMTHDGRCEEAETFVRGMIARRPSSPAPYDTLARLLAATGAPTEAIVRVEQQADALRPEGEAPTAVERMRRERLLAIARGDFAGALSIVRAIEALETGRVDAAPAWVNVEQGIRLLLETGDREGAKREMESFLDRLPSYELDDDWAQDESLSAYETAYALGVVPYERLLGARERTLKAFPIADPFDRWALSRLSLTPTLEEARDDLAAAPPPEVLDARRATLKEVPQRAYRIGVAFLRVGDAVRARPWLEQAARACAWGSHADPVMPDVFAFQQVHAWLAVGQAREATGDKALARDAYREVLRRWGAAKPRSVTGDTARVRLRKLGG